MKERPILFSGPMVRAILAGQKTQTRRIVRLPAWFADEFTVFGGEIQKEVECPYGVTGDRLWVRETFTPHYFDDGRPGYRADWNTRASDVASEPRWRPSIFMPRELSRITLDIASVRVERLQNISEDDARAEGVSSDADMLRALRHVRGAAAVRAVPSRLHSARNNFAALWDEINGERAPWSSNPWVWAVSFARVT